GGSSCIFEVTYSSRTFWKRRIATTASLAVVAMGAAFFESHSTLASYSLSIRLLPILTLVSMVISFLGLTRYLGVMKYIQQYNEQSRARAVELHENYRKLDRRYQESNLLRELSMMLTATINPKEVISTCLSEMDRRFGYPRSIAMLLSTDSTRLYTTEAKGFSQGIEQLYALSIKYPGEKSEPELFANILARGQTTSILDLDAYIQKLKPQNRHLIESLGVNSIIAAPVQDSTQKYGLLVIGSTNNERRLNTDDERLLDNIARLLSLSFQNATNFEREKGLRSLFQKYVPALVLDGLNSDKPTAPRSAVATSIFVDLRDFTKRCENLSPEKVLEMVNLYSQYVTTRIASAGGFVDKLAGDGVNAFFSSKVEQSTLHAKSATIAALRILSDIEELDAEFQRRGFGPVGIGIGLHSGRVTIGSMGSDQKLDYTALGDTVNIAARLQDLSKTFRDRTASGRSGVVIISASTLSCSDLGTLVDDIGEVEIRGRKQAEKIHYVDTARAIQWKRLFFEKYGSIEEAIRNLDQEESARLKLAS
ncbi:MAG: adenylate/guanylate cyclase domain-containing protein, partial [Bdellovibrionota bacterium]